MEHVIKTFADACKAVGTTEEEFNAAFELLPEKFRSFSKNHGQIVIIVEALNEGWKPDWTDYSQYKYFPYFRHESGFGLAFDDFGYWRTCTHVGSRLCFKSAELAKYAATQFKEMYRDYMTL